MSSFRLKIVTPDGIRFDGEAESVTVNTESGYVEIMSGHVNYMASLKTGVARIKADGKERYASISGGFITVKDNLVSVISITFEFEDEIDLERAYTAKEKANELLSKAKDDKALDIAKAKLSRALNRIKVAER